MKNTPQTFLITVIAILALLFPALPAVAQSAAGSTPTLAAAPQAGETCVVLQPGPTTGVDAYIKKERPDERRGTDPELRVKGEANKLERSLLKFDLSSLPTDATVSSATLSLYVKAASGGALTINAHRVTQSWNEDQVTWKARDKAANLLWTTQGGDYDSAVAASAVVDDTKNIWRSWTITSLVTDWLSNPATNYGLILEASSSNAEKVFKSSDDGTTNQRPKLEVCFRAALTLTPDNSGEGLAGQTKTYAHTITVGNLTSAIDLSASSSRGWAVRIYRDVNGNGAKDPEDTEISQTPVIGPNATFPILVQVDIPVGMPLGMLDTTTVTAVAQTGGKTATATDTTRVGQLLALQPNYSRNAVPGTVQFFGHVVFNNGSTQDCVTLTANSSAGWTVLLWEDLNRNGVHETSSPNEPAVTNPVCIDPGKAFYLVAEVQVPAGAAAGTTDQTVIRAASGAVPGKSGAATDKTTVIANTPPVVDGKYDEIYNVSPDATAVCYNDQNGTLFGKLATFYQAGSDGVYMTLAIDKDFVDNTYGANAIGWPGGHTFSELVGSDHAQFYGYDADGAKVLDFKLDYLSAKSGTPSGYASLGVLGGDGKMNIGNAAHILQWSTSLSNSLNAYGYCAAGVCSGLGTNLLVDSPATDEFYTPNPTYPNWDFNVIYEVKISPAAFGAAGFGSLEIPYIHASPSKLGTNTIYAEPGVCPGEIGDTVWNDLNHDGVQDPGEPGLAGVQVKLYRDDGDLLFDPSKDTVVGTQTTNANGKYLFQNVAPGDYFAVVVESTVPAGYIITTNNSPTTVFNLPEGGVYLDADFGYARPWGEYQISKTLTSGNPAVVGGEVTYRIRVVNTGATVINFLPLQDLYDPSKLQFVGATPAPNSTGNGVLNWSDLTASFGRDLGPGQAFEVDVRFLAIGATRTTLAAAAGLSAEPVVDGRLDSSYNYLGRYDPPAVDTPARLYGYAGANMCYWALVVDRSYNDNVYADTFNAYLSLDGWTQAHKFSNLTGSDNAVFNITYPGGSYTGLTLDYLAGAPGAWQSGQTAKDGSMAPGTPPIADAMTSLHWNMENSGWTDLTQSPPYNYNATSGKYWEWAMIYEFSIPKSRMNGVCGTATFVSAHNSPAKEKGMASIGDTVYGDADRNGAQNAGEIGLPNIVVNLYQGATLVRTTTTEPGPSGYYIFNNLAAGTYRVDVDESTLPTNYALTSNNEPMTVTLTTGQKFLAADFGYWLRATASIGDRVFYDVDASGLPDGGTEPGINGVKVDLYTGTCAARTGLWSSQVTSGNGNYSFTQLPAGSYCVDVDESTLPAGYALTTANEPRTVNLADGQNFTTADFGYRAACPSGVPNVAVTAGVVDETGSALATRQSVACVDIEPRPGAIGDYVWYDANGNGIEDVAEPGIANVTLRLYRDNGNGVFDPLSDTLVLTTTTDADGGYLFGGLAAGTYFVRVTDANGVLTGLTHIVGGQSQPSPTGPIVLGPGQVYKDADFGYYRAPGSGEAVVGDTVWYDANGDGFQQPGEPGIPGVRVVVTDSLGAVIGSAVTDGQGRYLIVVPAGADYVAGPDLSDGGTAAALAGLERTTVVPAAIPPLAAGEQYLAADFGYRDDGTVLGRIGNLVFYDANKNGVYDSGDAPLGGVSVDLIRDANGNGVWDAGEPIVATVTSGTAVDGETGNYGFTGVPAGRYLVHVSDTNAVLNDYEKSVLGTAGADGHNQADPYAIVLAAGGSNLTADFGYVRAARPDIGVIGNQVWVEDDGNGVFDPMDGDLGVAGVTVALLQNGSVIATTTTGASGDYSFVGLPAGTYAVTVTDVFNVLSGYDVTVLGPHPGQDNNNQAQPYTVVLGADEMNLTADFGYITGPSGGQAAPNYQITKVLNGPREVRTGSEISFTIRIVNTGDSPIIYLPLRDTYDSNYLTYGFGGKYATPDSDDHVSDGELRWANVLDVAGGGPGVLAPNAAVEVVVYFTARADTTALPGGKTVNVATVSGAWAKTGVIGPSGTDLVLLTTQSAQDNVGVINPTGLVVTGLTVRATESGVVVEWGTANEAQVLGFRVLRRPAGDGAYAVVTPEVLVAEQAGTSLGSRYRYEDGGVGAGAWEYALEVLLLDGRTEQIGPVAVVK